MLRRAGYSPEKIEEVLRGFPDPLDEHDCAALERQCAISLDTLMDRMGGSP